MKFIPHKYQAYAAERIADTEAIGLFLEMGLGKTVITLTAIDKLLYDSFESSKVLIIAPLRVAQDTWSRESSKWDHTKHLTISQVLGPVKKREAALKADADIYIINRENVQWLVGYYGSKWPFDTVVIDELSSFKNSDSQRFRALRRVRPLMKRIIGLTGTPAPNGLLDLWSQVYLLDRGQRLGETIGYYRDRYFIAAERDGHVVHKWRQKKESEEHIYKAIEDICISMKAEDWLDMPERIDRIVPIKLSEKSRAQYEQLEEDLLLPMVGADVVASTAAVLSNKLLQMANGAVYDEDRAVQHIHDGKLEALEDLVEAANGKPLLVFYGYKHDLARIQKAIPGARKLETNADIEEWNAGNIPVMLAHPASAGHGLNLQDGGNQVVWFSITWSLELYEQANARLYRQGQQNRVIIHHLITEGTMDEDVMKALEGKAAGQNALMQAVKARIGAIAK